MTDTVVKKTILTYIRLAIRWTIFKPVLFLLKIIVGFLNHVVSLLSVV